MSKKWFILVCLAVLLATVSVVSAAVTTTTRTQGDYEIVVFTGSGTTEWSVPAGVTECDYLIVGGGGGGGYSEGGGGGGGGVVTGTGLSVSGHVDIAVGAGGVGSSSTARGGTGGNSSADAVVAVGGGGGGTVGGTQTGGAGGSGGGSANGAAAGSGTAGQGYAGGVGATSGVYGAGGGGGAYQVGSAGTSARGGRGGDGVLSDMSGNWRRYGGGGGGGAYGAGLPGQPGDGGGGQGGWSVTYPYGTNGADEYGGGGGGGCTNGGNGGTGIVVLRYVGDAKASFTVDVESGIVPLTVHFTDTSSGQPDTWYWEFGDGDTSTSQNPTHVYDDYGFYTVNFKATNDYSSDWENTTDCISVIDPRIFAGSKYVVIDGSDAALTYYEIPLYLHDSAGADSGDDIYLGGTVRNDWSDIRFTAPDAVGAIHGVDYWIETSTSTDATVWISVPYIPTTSVNVTIYYGNASLTNSLSDARRTFHAYDDFEDGSLDYWDTTEGYEWQVVSDVKYSGSYAARGRNFLFQDNAGGQLLREHDRFGNDFSNYSISFDVRSTSLGSASCAGVYLLTRFEGVDIYAYQWRDAGYVTYNIGDSNDDRQHYPSSPQYSANTWYHASLTFDQVAATMSVTQGGTNLGTVSAHYYPSGTNLGETDTGTITPFPPSTFLYGSPEYAWFDNIIVRSYRNPEPYADGTEEIPAPVADFSADVTNGYHPLDVQFTDLSTDASSWDWDFGDLTAHSYAQNPLHTYTADGTYTVTLNATNTYGSDEEEKVDYITVTTAPTPVTDFSANVTSGDIPLYVAFTDSTTESPTSWYWLFGDTGWSTDQNPVHEYSAAGLYTVSLYASNAYGGDWENKTNYITASDSEAPPIPQFAANYTTVCVNDVIQFTDYSLNTPTTWFWLFGDSQDAHTEDPTHSYDTAGTYTVSLNASNDDGFAWENKTNYITVVDMATDFVALPRYGVDPLTVSFADLTTCSPTAWNWTFGDGDYSSEQNPTHIYDAPGTYDVFLNASGSAGYDWENKTGYIQVVDQNTSSGSGVYYATHDVRWTVKTYSGIVLRDIFVTATPSNTTYGAWSWIADLLGISSSVDIKNASLNGTTGQDGSIVFLMIPEVEYTLTFTNATQGVNMTVKEYPQSTDYIIYVESTGDIELEPMSSCINHTPYDSMVGGTATIGMIFTDPCGSTTNATVAAYYSSNGTFIDSHSHTPPGTTENNISKTFPYVSGTDYKWAVIINSSYGNFTYWSEMSAPVTPITSEVPAWVFQWGAVGFLCLLGACFSVSSVKFGVLIIPVFAGVFAWMGWITVGAAVVPFLITVGALYYIRSREREVT